MYIDLPDAAAIHDIPASAKRTAPSYGNFLYSTDSPMASLRLD